MDRLHITEFASDRYFEKLHQLRDGNSRNQHHDAADEARAKAAEGLQTGVQSPHLHRLSQSPFILPLRGSHANEAEDGGTLTRPSDQKRSEKHSRFLSFRIFHPKTPCSPSPNAVQLGRRPSAAEPVVRQSLPFEQMFKCLPNELQIQIIASLPLSDILNLRRGSRSLHALVSLNEAPIVRYHLDHHVPVYARRLYPAPAGRPLSFHHLCGIWHRLHVSAKLSDLMCEWIMKEIFLRNTVEKKLEFAPQRERMRRRLIPLLFTIFHFFETYRDLHSKYVMERDGKGLLRQPYTVNPIEARIMDMYDDQTLFRVHQVFPLVISSFCRRLRPPSYVGRVERTVRGYLREKPPDHVHVAILCLGGLREVEKIWEVKGYNARRDFVDLWYQRIVKSPADTEPKKRRGMLSLGRRKSIGAVGKGSLGENPQCDGRRESADKSAGSVSGTAAPGSASFVFNTSLSAGRPMDALSREQIRLLLPDLPLLQKIWLETAEAMILDRKIVERASDIKRNGDVLRALIQEDGVEEEDQWWYGAAASDSVRPNLDAIEEDTLD